MKKFLNDIRSAENPISGNRKIINTIAILLLGVSYRITCNNGNQRTLINP